MNGENTPDCMLARNGRPVITCGFHSGTSGRLRIVYSVNGWSSAGMSSNSGFAGRSSEAGLLASHGALNQNESEFESVRPGTIAGAKNAIDSSARMSAAARFGRAASLALTAALSGGSAPRRRRARARRER